MKEPSRSAFPILVVDDSALYRRLIEESLSADHYDLRFAKDGQEALKLFAVYQPPLVITDWTMPDISGIELCQAVRREFRELYPHIILLTSHSDKEQLIQGLAAGADDYLTKPFHPGELQARVRVGRRIAELHKELAEKNYQLEQLALTDPLTGLSNRRAVEIWAARQLSGAARHGFTVWVIMADLDHFKSINDTYGHDTGDAVLKSFADILKSNTRHSDMSGRLGGEEFIFVISHVSDKANVYTAIDRIRREFEGRTFTVGDRAFHASASFGIVGLRGNCVVSFHDLLRSADAALYAAKQSGRNCLRFADN